MYTSVTKNRETNFAQKRAFKTECMRHVYNILVKYLGKPINPFSENEEDKTFTWMFETEDHVVTSMQNLTPHVFRKMLLADLDLDDFVVLTSIPPVKRRGKDDRNGRTYLYETLYEVRDVNNVMGGNPISVLNLPIEELKKYSLETMKNGIAVWFVGDVGRSFSWIHSALNEKLVNNDLLLGDEENDGKINRANKGERFLFGTQAGSHAMAFTGWNPDVDNDAIATDWQVENSWGYWDPNLPGLDGWLTMDDSWFTENVTQVAIPKQFLSRHIQGLLNQDPVVLDPWDGMAPALRVTDVKIPEAYKNKEKHREFMMRTHGRR
jgi:bleomycin hydrolase